MIGTLAALVIAFLLHFTAIGQDTIPNLPIMGVILVIVATIFLFLPSICLSMAWTPLQFAEHQLTPRVSELFAKDRHLKFVNAILILFPLLTYVIAIDMLFLNIFNKNILLPIWIVFLGIALDALHYLIKRVSSYLDPFHVVSILTQEAGYSIQNDKEEDLCNWIDSLSEIAIRSMARSSTSLCIQVNDELQHVTRIFLESAKSISHPLHDAQSKEMGIGDKVSYTLFFVLQRLEMINAKASEQRLEPVCSNIITVLGKITIDAAKCDISMATYPLHFLGKFAIEAQKRGVSEVGAKAILTLLEVAKTILNEIDVTYMALVEPFSSLILQMNEITKEMFKNDKSLNIKLLTQPFHDLKALFTTEKMSKHQDSPEIIQQIDKVLAEYDALDAVLRSLPPIPPVSDTAIS